MKWFSRIIVAIVILIALTLALYIFYFMYKDRTSPEQALPIIHEQKGIYYAIAIDVDEDNAVTAETIADGKDAVLMVKANSKLFLTPTTEKRVDYYIFNGAKTLYEHDKNFDGSIKLDDPIYDDLLLATFQNHNFKVVPLKLAGISQIIFNNDYLDLVKSGHDAPSNMNIGFAVFLTGAKHSVKIVPLPVVMFESKRLMP